MFGIDKEEQYRAVADFRSALRHFLASTDTSVRAHGLTPGQYDLLVMCEAAGAEGATITSLAARLALAGNSVTELVDRAVAAGVAVRHPDQLDGRVTRVRPTDAGRERLAAAVATLTPERRRLLELLADVSERLATHTRHSAS